MPLPSLVCGIPNRRGTGHGRRGGKGCNFNVEQRVRRGYGCPWWCKVCTYGYVWTGSRSTRASRMGLRRRFVLTLGCGEWSRLPQHFHEPAPSVGLLCKLWQADIHVVLIDEHCTSAFCPDCPGRVNAFKTVPNPQS